MILVLKNVNCGKNSYPNSQILLIFGEIARIYAKERKRNTHLKTSNREKSQILPIFNEMVAI